MYNENMHEDETYIEDQPILYGFGPLAGYLHPGDIVHSIGNNDENLYVEEESKVLETSTIDEDKNITLTLESSANVIFTVTVPAETEVDLEPPF